MPRGARAVLPGCPLHIVQRGLNRNSCFFAEGDYVRYLRYLGSFSAQFEWDVHAYCLMTNHVHLLLTPRATDSCALLMKNLGQCYVQACYRYIELNPVRAGIVREPSQYRWSSHAENAGYQATAWLKAHSAYAGLGAERAHCISAYRALCDERLSEPLVEEIRRATRVGYPVGAQRRARGRPWAAR